MKRVTTIIILIHLGRLLPAQDPAFSQYYAAPLYLNPAFTGTSFDHRFIANYRNQWPNITNGFVTSAFSYDYNLMAYNSGVGLLASFDRAGSAGLRSSQINFLYSYKFPIANKWVIATGLNFGYASRMIDFNRLLFGDQLQFDVDGNAPTDDPALSNLGASRYFDFATGILLYNKNYWLGAAVHHLNQPNRSLLNESALLPVRTTLHGGARFPLYHGPFKEKREAAIAPSFVYKHQDRFSQLDIGAYLLYEPIVFGLWYRGIPVKENAADNMSRDAMVVILGFQFERFEFSYSYDFTVSELGPISGGAHELALKYKIAIQTRAPHKKREKFIPCPASIRR